MGRLVLVRVVAVVPMLLLVSLATFLLLNLSRTDPAELIVGANATQAQVDAKRAELGLDEPVMQRYGEWLGDAVHGDLGTSYYGGAEVTDAMVARLPVTLSLLVGGLLVAALIGVPLGIVAARNAGGPTDRVVTTLASFGMAVPSFFLAMMLVAAFAVGRDWFPAVGYVGPTDSVVDWLRSIALPCVSLGLAASASFARQSRSAVISVLQLEYVRTARAKGLGERTVLLRHALRNASIPLVTLGAFQASAVLGQSVIVERVFALPGLGTWGAEAAVRKDIPVVLAFVMIAAITVVLVNLLADISYGLLSPKLRVA